MASAPKLSYGPSHPNQIILGKRRGRWVRDAARAIIASTTPSGRFLILRGGFLEFQDRALPRFKELSPFTFNSSELRWIFEYLAWAVLTPKARGGLGERHLQHGFEELYQRQLRQDVIKPEPEEVPDGSDMVIESVVDGSLKSVLAVDLKPTGGYRR